MPTAKNYPRILGMAPHAYTEKPYKNIQKSHEGVVKNPKPTSSADQNSLASALVPSERHTHQKQQSAARPAPNIKVPEGSITEYTDIQYRLSTRAKPGNLNARTCLLIRQQYKMHECCKAVNELKAMTSVISPTFFPFSSPVPHFQPSSNSMVPLHVEAKATLRLDWET